MTDAVDTATRRRLLAATSIGSALAFLDVTVVNVALPAIGRDLELGLSGQQGAVLSYALTLSACYLAAGAVADRIGLQRAFRAGTLAFAVASIGVGFASSEALLLLGRAVQGVAAALLTTSSLALLRASWAKDAGRAIGLWTSFTSAAILVGPPLGGAVVELASWRWIFLVNVPLAVLAIVLASDRGRPLAMSESTRAPDAWSLAVATLSIGGVTALLVERSALGGDRAAMIAVVVAVSLAVVVRRQRGGATPLIPGELLRRRSFVAALAATVTMYGALGASGFFASLYLQSPAVGYTAFEAGIVQVPTTVVLLALAPTFGRIADRRGPRGLLIAGAL
ncbi:MAG: transporter, partial [Thermoleophilia bacterium]|nr:transporter [Thermoleophilia bacterium]